MLSKEERLLVAIFANNTSDIDATKEAIPTDTESTIDKVIHAQYSLNFALEKLAPTLTRLARFRSLLQVCETQKSELPNIIANNEANMALKHLAKVKFDVDTAFQELTEVFKASETEGKKNV